MKFLILIIPLFISCWPLSTVRTIECYVDPDTCAQTELKRSTWYKSYKIVKVDPDKNRIKARLLRKESKIRNIND